MQPEDLIPVLITHWEAAGHSFGVDNHLQLQQLLQHFPPEEDLANLKFLLAPIFADTPQKQEEFYQLFDDVLRDTELALREHEDTVFEINNRTVGQKLKNAKRSTSSRWNGFSIFQKLGLVGITSALLLSIFTISYYIKQLDQPAKQEKRQTSQVMISMKKGTRSDFCMQTNEASIGKPVSVLLRTNSTTLVKTAYEIEQGDVCFTNTALANGRESVIYQICYESDKCIDIELIFHVANVSGNQPSQRFFNKGNLPIRFQRKVAEASNSIDVVDLGLPNKMGKEKVGFDSMIMSVDPSQAVDGVTSSIGFANGFAYFSRAKAILLGLAGISLLLLGWFIRRQRQQFTMAHQNNNTLPKSWDMRIPTLNAVDLGEIFHNNLRKMLQRDKHNSRFLDVPETISSSLKKGGAIDFKFLQFKQGRKYVFLLDNTSQNDHRAKSLSLFIKRLRAEGAPIDYFFFERDPQNCWSREREVTIPIGKIAHDYQNHQLVICSDAATLLDGNELKDWTKVFNSWNKKLILIPKIFSEWSDAEAVLQSHFRLLPCTPNGLSILIDALESVEPLNYQNTGFAEEDEKLHTLIQNVETLKGATLIEYLESQFVHSRYGSSVDLQLRWIAACAIPPVLFWHWTLYVGQLLSDKIHNHLSLENLFQIFRLSWYSEGKIPEDVRLTLISWLEEKHPAWLKELREEWDEVLNLEGNLPPLGSLAWEGHRLEVVLNELLQDPSWLERRELELELEQLIHAKKEQDAMVIKYMENKRGVLDALLSNRFRKFVQEKEGLFWRLRMWVWQVPVFVMLSLGALLFHFNQPVTTFQFKEGVKKLVFSNDSKTFMVASGRGSLALCTVEGAWVQGIDRENQDIVGLDFDSNNTKILTASSSNIVTGWDISGIPLYVVKGESERIKAADFHPTNPNIILSGSFDNKAELWNSSNGELLLEMEHESPVRSVAFSPVGDLLVTGDQNGNVQLWNVSGDLIRAIETKHGKIHALDFSPDGQHFAVGSRDNVAQVYNKYGKLIHTLKGHTYDVFDVSFSPDGQKLVTASGDDTAIIWSMHTGKKIQSFGGHWNYISSASFSPNGKFLLTGDRTGKVKLWTLGK